jgi:hypothetical protein
MPLYEVRRTDDILPGQFDNALVIASGTGQARTAVAHLLPKGAKVEATKLDVSGPRGGGKITLLMTYYDESPTLDDALADDAAPFHVDGI